MAKRRSDILESFGEQAVMFGISGLVLLGIGVIILAYNGFGAGLQNLGWILAVVGGAGVLFAGVQLAKSNKVHGLDVACIYCDARNTFTEFPTEDFRCTACNRSVPIKDGKVLPVFQVRCGYCNTLNYYNEKTEVLICEECDHEIPIAREDGKPVKHVMKAYAVTDDDRSYELVLTGTGHKNEELIAALQHMLALNRNQVKQMLGELPVTILTGITRKKAEMIQAQLAIHEGVSEFHALPD